MGAWGILAFDNDDANDWAYSLENVANFSVIEAAFAQVKDAGDYLEAPDACNALAACEVLARLQGNHGYKNSYTAKVDQWVIRHPAKPPAALLAKADSIIDRILAKDSELRQLWEEGDATEWLESVEDLRRRLRA